jgi:hypothetical protein
LVFAGFAGFGLAGDAFAFGLGVGFGGGDIDDVEVCDFAGDDFGAALAGCAFAGWDFGGALAAFGFAGLCFGDISVNVIVGGGGFAFLGFGVGFGGGDIDDIALAGGALAALGFGVGLGGGDIDDIVFAGGAFGALGFGIGLGGGDIVPSDLDGWWPTAWGRSADVGVRLTGFSAVADAGSEFIAAALAAAEESSVLKMGPFFMAAQNADLTRWYS